MMGAEDHREVLDARSGLRKRVLERGHAIGSVHPGIDQRPLSAAAIDQVNVDDRRPHRQRQENLENSGTDLYNFGWHQFRLPGRRFAWPQWIGSRAPLPGTPRIDGQTAGLMRRRWPVAARGVGLIIRAILPSPGKSTSPSPAIG